MKKSKRIASPGSFGNSPAISKRSFKVMVTARLVAKIKALSKPARKAVGEAISAVQRAWGEPHVHGGVGIRRLRANLFECRVTLDTRLAFICSCEKVSSSFSHWEIMTKFATSSARSEQSVASMPRDATRLLQRGAMFRNFDTRFIHLFDEQRGSV